MIKRADRTGEGIMGNDVAGIGAGRANKAKG